MTDETPYQLTTQIVKNPEEKSQVILNQYKEDLTDLQDFITRHTKRDGPKVLSYSLFLEVLDQEDEDEDTRDVFKAFGTITPTSLARYSVDLYTRVTELSKRSKATKPTLKAKTIKDLFKIKTKPIDNKDD